MTLRVGDIWGIFAPTVGKEKYHLCVCVGTEGDAHRFLYLNTGDHYQECFAVPCSDIPCLPVSKSGQSVFSFIEAPRYNDHQLEVFKARYIGRLSAAVAGKVRVAAEQTTLLTRKDKVMVLEGLAQITDD